MPGKEQNINALRDFSKDVLQLLKFGENLKNLTTLISKKNISATDRNIAFDSLAIVMIPVLAAFALVSGCFKEFMMPYCAKAFQATFVCLLFSAAIDYSNKKRSLEINKKDKKLIQLQKKDSELERQIRRLK